MTEEEAEQLRSQVPDDPIRLPADHLACEGCGVAVPFSDPTAAVEPRRTATCLLGRSSSLGAPCVR